MHPPANDPRESKLAARDVSVRYGSKLAIEHVDFDVSERTVTALIGPSGCGKSTFLRVLNRMHDLDPDAHVSGDVFLDGGSILDESVDVVSVRRRIGMVFQRSTPFPKSIFDNIAFGLRVAGEHDRGAIEERVEESLRGAALWDEVKDRLREGALTLSGGQQQRLCIARAIATRPEVLLMDEPASALDPLATEQIEALIGELVKKYTIVIVTHSLAQANRVSDHVAFFFMGKLVEVGRTEDVLAHPRDERAREYVSGRLG